MSDKKDDDAIPPETMRSSTPPTLPTDVDVSADVVTVYPPPLDAASDVPKIPPPPPPVRPRAASQPALGKNPTPVPAMTKRTPTLKDDDDRPSFFDVFDVERHEAEAAKAQAEAVQEKPADKAAQRGSRPDQREISRSRKIVDEDLFNLSSSLFSNQSLTPLVAPDVSALGMSGLGKDLTTAPKAAEPAAAAKNEPAAANPLFLAPPPVTAPPAQKSSIDAIDVDVDVAAAGGKLDRKRIAIGVVLVAALAGLVFFGVQSASTKPEDPASAVATESTTTSPDDPANDTPPALRTADTAQAPAPNTAAAAPADTAATKGGAEAPADKRDTKADAPKGDGRDKPAGGADKQPDKPADTKAAEPAQPSSGNKAQDLAAAMAAANKGGASAPAPAPAGGGGEFSRSAASSALGAAAGRAAGCRSPTDPAGTARVSVTFAPSGRATSAIVNGPPFAGTRTGGCIAAAFRSASVPPFSGGPVTVSKSVTIR
ncbi:hypothetical protein [Polyangium spumosum]|uniref:AgmX/PglI C-terminal domain-containing protein n=1 Tax=Polyangium spumosum TaxID=889282 RepID=A0A6N7PTQ8_9BACT|nr:hypothetical protein [Polyangium spumosum]MRG93464.1 hypothetical protein [Polyangium spumosum]